MFKTARFRLTAWYILILMSVSIAFSVAIFRGMSTEVERFAHQQRLRVERRFDELGILRLLLIDDEMIQDAKQKTVILHFNLSLTFCVVRLAICDSPTLTSSVRTLAQKPESSIRKVNHQLGEILWDNKALGEMVLA